MRERFGAEKPASWAFRTGAGSGASQLTAQQPENNIVRVTLNALAAILGGAQSLHTAAYDEALALPTEQSVKLALRTQQVLAHEAGLTEVIDPLAGSYYVEALTDRDRGARPRAHGRDRAAGRHDRRHRVGLGAAADRRCLVGAPAARSRPASG